MHARRLVALSLLVVFSACGGSEPAPTPAAEEKPKRAAKLQPVQPGPDGGKAPNIIVLSIDTQHTVDQVIMQGARRRSVWSVTEDDLGFFLGWPSYWND